MGFALNPTRTREDIWSRSRVGGEEKPRKQVRVDSCSGDWRNFYWRQVKMRWYQRSQIGQGGPYAAAINFY